jgi:branched-chain amino acid transport system ATP-binding protein
MSVGLTAAVGPTGPNDTGAVMAILELEKLHKQFGGVTAVSDVSMRIEEGERVGVIGPNGAGKTTLFKLISGDDRASEGRITFRGKDVTRMPAHRRARLGMGRTYQITNLFPTLSVRENLELGSVSCGDRATRGTRLRSVIERFRLDGVVDKPVSQLAYGEQRRLELALALCGGACTLLLDEPAAGLDAADRALMQEVLTALPDELTVLLVEHDIELALGLVDRVVCLYNGELIADESPEGIREHPTVAEVYLGKN